MCERKEGAVLRVLSDTAPLRRPAPREDRPGSHPERLGHVGRRVVKGLLKRRIIGGDDHGIVTGL